MIKFTKMHGLGNDFVVIDAINQSINLPLEKLKLIADRNLGIGCDQILLVEKPVTHTADFKYRIFNADGNEVSQCGNGARCFAAFVRDKKLSSKDKIVVDTNAGQLTLNFDQDQMITVNMGIPTLIPAEIPLNTEQQLLLYGLNIDGREINFAAVSMGNPHAVIQVEDINNAPVAELGKTLESHSFFPERANIGFMQIMNRHTVKLRVYERGAAETLACGSGACAAVVAGIEQNLLDHNNICVELPGGKLSINWLGRGQAVYMKGPAESVFEGQIEL